MQDVFLNIHVHLFNNLERILMKSMEYNAIKKLYFSVCQRDAFTVATVPTNSFKRFTLISCLIACVPYRLLFNMVSFIISLLCSQRSEPMKSTRVLLSLLF